MSEPNFEKAQSALVSFRNEIESLKAKYGENSKWVLEKEKVFKELVIFHDATAETFDYQDQLIKLMASNIKMLKLLLYKKEMDLPWIKMMKARGVDVEKYGDIFKEAQILDESNQVMNEHFKSLTKIKTVPTA